MITPQNLTESFQYSASTPNERCQSQDQKKAKVNCFEKLLRSDFITMMSNTQDNEAIITTQVDDFDDGESEIVKLKLADEDAISISPDMMNATLNSLQICVAAIFGMGVDSFEQNGGILPQFQNISFNDFGHDISEWVERTNYRFIRIGVDNHSKLLIPLTNGTTCIMHLRNTEGKFHNVVGVVLEDMTLRCIMNPSDDVKVDMGQWHICWVGAFHLISDEEQSDSNSTVAESIHSDISNQMKMKLTAIVHTQEDDNEEACKDRVENLDAENPMCAIKPDAISSSDVSPGAFRNHTIAIIHDKPVQSLVDAHVAISKESGVADHSSEGTGAKLSKSPHKSFDNATPLHPPLLVLTVSSEREDGQEHEQKESRTTTALAGVQWGTMSEMREAENPEEAENQDKCIAKVYSEAHTLSLNLGFSQTQFWSVRGALDESMKVIETHQSVATLDSHQIEEDEGKGSIHHNHTDSKDGHNKDVHEVARMCEEPSVIARPPLSLQLGFSQSQVLQSSAPSQEHIIMSMPAPANPDVSHSKGTHAHAPTSPSQIPVRPALQLGFSPTQPATEHAVENEDSLLNIATPSDCQCGEGDGDGEGEEFVFLSALTGNTLSAHFSLSCPPLPSASSQVTSDHQTRGRSQGIMLTGVSQFDEEEENERERGDEREHGSSDTCKDDEETTPRKGEGGGDTEVDQIVVKTDHPESERRANEEESGTQLLASKALPHSESLKLSALSDRHSTMSTPRGLGPSLESRCSTATGAPFTVSGNDDSGWITSKNATRKQPASPDVLAADTSESLSQLKDRHDERCVEIIDDDDDELNVRVSPVIHPAALSSSSKIIHTPASAPSGAPGAPAAAVHSIHDIAALTSRLEAMEKALLAREALLAEKEQLLQQQLKRSRVSVNEKEGMSKKGVSFNETVEGADGCPQSHRTKKSRRNEEEDPPDTLSQGGMLAVDGLLQLGEMEKDRSAPKAVSSPLSNDISSRLQWSSLARAVTSRPVNTKESDNDATNSPRKKSRLMRRTVGKISSPSASGVSSPSAIGRTDVAGNGFNGSTSKSCFDFECSEGTEESVLSTPPLSLDKSKTSNAASDVVSGSGKEKGTVSQSKKTPVSSSSSATKSGGGLVLMSHSGKRRIEDSDSDDSDDDGEWNSQADLSSVHNPALALQASSSKAQSVANLTKSITKTPTPGGDKLGVTMDVANHIPSSVLEMSARDLKDLLWKDLWKELEAVGWHWQKGRGLVDFVYCRPGHRCYVGSGSKRQPANEGVEGLHYFISTDDVVAYVSQFLRPAPPTPDRSERNKASGDLRNMAAKEHAGSGSEHKQVNAKAVRDKNFPCDDQHSDSSLSEVGNDADLGAEDGSDLSSSSSRSERHSWLSRVGAMPWAELWRNLQEDGWTWAHGSGLVTTWYLAPGVDKPSRGSTGSTVFGDEEELRSHILRTLCKDIPQSNFTGHDRKQRGDGDGQFGDDWTLSKHRSKRNLRPKPTKTKAKAAKPKSVMSASGSGGAGGSEGNGSVRKSILSGNSDIAASASGRSSTSKKRKVQGIMDRTKDYDEDITQLQV